MTKLPSRSPPPAVSDASTIFLAFLQIIAVFAPFLYFLSTIKNYFVFLKIMLAFFSKRVIINLALRDATSKQTIRGYSSAGRALEWHSRGQRFDPAYLHHRKSHRKPFGLRCFSLFSGKFQTFYTKLIFAQNRQNWVLSTKSVNKSEF